MAFFRKLPGIRSGPIRPNPIRERSAVPALTTGSVPARCLEPFETKPANRLPHRAPQIGFRRPEALLGRIFKEFQWFVPKASPLEVAIWSDRADPSTPGLGENAAPAKFLPAAILNAGLTPLA